MLPRERQVERTGALEKTNNFVEPEKEVEERVDPPVPRYLPHHRVAAQYHHLPRLGRVQDPELQVVVDQQ